MGAFLTSNAWRCFRLLSLISAIFFPFQVLPSSALIFHAPAAAGPSIAAALITDSAQDPRHPFTPKIRNIGHPQSGGDDPHAGRLADKSLVRDPSKGYVVGEDDLTARAFSYRGRGGGGGPSPGGSQHNGGGGSLGGGDPRSGGDDPSHGGSPQPQTGGGGPSSSDHSQSNGGGSQPGGSPPPSPGGNDPQPDGGGQPGGGDQPGGGETPNGTSPPSPPSTTSNTVPSQPDTPGITPGGGPTTPSIPDPTNTGDPLPPSLSISSLPSNATGQTGAGTGTTIGEATGSQSEGQSTGSVNTSDGDGLDTTHSSIPVAQSAIYTSHSGGPFPQTFETPGSSPTGSSAPPSSSNTSGNNASGASSAKSNTKMIAGVVVGIIVPLIILLAVYFWWRRRSRERNMFNKMGSRYYQDMIHRENGTHPSLASGGVAPAWDATQFTNSSNHASLSHASSRDAGLSAAFPVPPAYTHPRSNPFSDEHGIDVTSMFDSAIAGDGRRSSISSSAVSSMEPSPAAMMGQARARTERQMHLFDEIVELQSKLIGLEAYGDADALRPEEVAETKKRIEKLEMMMETPWARGLTDVEPM